MEEYETVPLKSGDSELPAHDNCQPSVVYADISLAANAYRTVRLDDSSDYEVVPLQDSSPINDRVR